MTERLRIGALLSGGGRTLLNIADRIDAGDLDAEVAVVIASREGVAGVGRARDRGFDVHVLDDDEAITATLLAASVNLVCLCGYLRLLRIDAAFEGRIINIHPALLPDFGGPGMYGERVHAAVLASGRTESGCTVHFVDEQYDHGPIILQRRCPVRPDDDVASLAARVFEQECIAYPEAIRRLAVGIA